MFYVMFPAWQQGFIAFSTLEHLAPIQEQYIL